MIIVITICTLLFLLAIGLDISPYLRGPAPYPPEWRWAYFFVNTFDRIWLPSLFIACVLFLFFKAEQAKSFFAKHDKLLLVLLILLSFGFQLSVLYFSRAGIGVLLHRIINPELNGYFTAALPITNVGEFLHTYNQQLLHFVYHAKAHPPGAILLFYWIKECLQWFPGLVNYLSSMMPSHGDVRVVWQTLSPVWKATALVSGFVVPFLSSLSLIPLYYTAKLLYDQKIAIRSAFLFLFIPSLVFFIPINDAFLHLFSITAFFFFVRGFVTKSMLSFFLSGVVLFVGVFFNLSLLPLTVFFFLYFLLRIGLDSGRAPLARMTINGLLFCLGFFLPPVLLFLFFQFNFIEMIWVIMKHVPDVHSRSYGIWIFYNLYDFLVFCGIPVAIVFLTEIKDTVRNLFNRDWKKLDLFLLAYVLMLLILNFSGSVRGETGRLWSVYIPFMVLLVAAFGTKKYTLTTKLFAVFLLLQAVQILVMQEFWVMLW